MKLKEYLENLNELIKENPDALNYTVVAASDDEGNSFIEVVFAPSLGNFKNGEFNDGDDGSEETEEEFILNAVCIN